MNSEKTTQAGRWTAEEVGRVVSSFQRHINRGQVRYLRAGHLDVIETQRKGIGFTDSTSGRRMIDCFSSAGSFNVSRHHPRLQKALLDALEIDDLGSHITGDIQRELARELAAIAPGDIDTVHFASGGGEAVDAAIKLARGATGREKLVATTKAYHGHTGFSLSVNGKEHYRAYCEPLLLDVEFVPFNDLGAMQTTVDEDTAAIIVEPVQGEAGIFVASDDYLRGLRELANRTGAMLIFDEIQTGFGRTGRMFASEHSGVVPDMMTIAKSLGGSLFPNAALLHRTLPLLEAFIKASPEFHTTYVGGSDLACKVSLEVIRVIKEEKLPENARRQGAKFLAILNELKRSRPRIIKEVRGLGLMVGIEYIHEFMGPMMSDALARQGVFAAYSGNAPQVMRFMVPLTINDEELERLGQAIHNAARDMDLLLPAALLAAKIPALRQALDNEKVQTTLFGSLRNVELAAERIRDVLRRGGSK